MALCEKHKPLAYRDWPKIDRLHKKNDVGWYVQIVGS